jgi:hypothetical protein
MILQIVSLSPLSMIYHNLFPLKKTLAIAVTVVGAYGSLSLPSLATPIPLQFDRAGVSTVMPERAIPSSFFPLQVVQNGGQSGDRGAPAPGQRVGGASRGRCPSASKHLTALVPIISTTADKSQNPVLASVTTSSVLGLTVTDRPTFWFYFPYALTPARPVEFILKDDKDNIIYQTELSESGTTPGVVGFKLPDTVPSLKANKRYNWFFTIACDAKDAASSDSEEPNKIFVSGWVERVPLNSALQRQLEQATPQQQARLYANAGIWHEAITTLAALRRQNPNDATLKQEWANLLRSVNLEAIAPEPITSMLTPKQ